MIENQVPQPQPAIKTSKKKMTLIIGGVLLSACCLLVVIAAIVSPSNKGDKTGSAVLVATTQPAAQAVQSTQATLEPTKPNATATDILPTEVPTEMPPTATSKPDIYLVGEQAEEEGIAITVLNVQTTDKVSFGSAEAGNTFLDVEVLIENIGRDETTPYNPMYFKVKDDSAAEYDTSFSSVEPSLKSGELQKGDKARGHVSFEVPKTAKGFTLSYEPLVIFGGYKPIRVNLDQKAENATDSAGTLEIGETQVGQRFESAGIAITIQSVKTAKTLGYFTADQGNTLLDIEVLIENVSRDEDTPYNPLYFKIKDSNYMEYNTSMTSLEPSLTSGDLQKADKVRGHVAFEVPADVTKFVVTYEPMVIFGGYKTIAINIVLSE